MRDVTISKATWFEPGRYGRGIPKIKLRRPVMSWLPGWNSVEAITQWHSYFNFAALVCLALLVMTQTLTQLYARRARELGADGDRSAIVSGSIGRDTRAGEPAVPNPVPPRPAPPALPPRTLNLEQQVQLVQLLGPAAKGKVAVVFASADTADAKPFALSIRVALEKAGFVIGDPPKSMSGSVSFDRPGAWIFVRDINHAPPFAGPIQSALKNVTGTLFEGINKPDDLEPDSIVIGVGAHP